MEKLSGLDIYAPVFEVKLNNEKISMENIASVNIDMNLDNPTMFSIAFNEELNVKTQKFKWLDNSLIKPGIMVDISFGYVNSKKPGLVKGRIKALTPGFLSSGNTSLNIEGYDLSHDLQKKQTEIKNKKKVTYSAIAEELAEKNGLKKNGVEPTKITHEKVDRKENESDHEILRRLSEEIGYEFFVMNDVLYFREPKDNLESDINFEFGYNFISFNPRMTSATAVNEVKITAWDGKKKEPISETASISDVKSKVGIPDFDSMVEQSQGGKINIKLEGRVVRSREEAKAQAIAELKRRNNGFITGSLECIGDPRLVPGMTINMKKVGQRFNGVYYITKAKHSIGDNGYETTLEVRRSVL